MGEKLLWTGLTFIVSFQPVVSAFSLNVSPALAVAGAVIMLIGCVLMWLDK